MTQDDLVDLGLIGRQVSKQAVRDLRMRVLNFLPLSTIEGGAVKAFSKTDPYGVLTVAVDVESPNEHRPHRALSLASPAPRRAASVASAAGELGVHRRDCLGGVVHEYVLAA